MITIQMQPLSKELQKLIYQGFSQHAIAMTGHDEKFESVSFEASDEGTFIGAAVVEHFWGALHIKYVYIEKENRSQGIGTMLMEKALAYGKENQCNFAFVETMSFQALAFYQKLGFQLEFTRSGYSHGTSFHYLRKDL